MKKPKGWPKRLQGGFREKRNKKEELPKRQPKKQRKMRETKKKKGKGSIEDEADPDNDGTISL